MDIFRVDGRVYKFLVRFLDLLKLNLLWLMFSIPIVTIGAATIAVYKVTLDMVEHKEGHITASFIKGFKENLKQGIPLGIITLVILYSAYLNLEFFNKLEGNPIYFLFAAIIILFLGLTHLIYAYPLCARYDNSLIKNLLNSGEITKKYFFKTLVLFFILALLIVLFMYNSTLLFFGLLIGPVCIFLTISGFVVTFFRDIESS